MRILRKNLFLAAVACVPVLVSTGAGAWWNDDDDYWGGPWGYPGYGGYGYPGYGGYGYPGYGGWGYPGYGGWGYPGYGGWGGYGHNNPNVIYIQPQDARPSQGNTIE